MLILGEHFTRHLEVFASFASGMSWKRVYVLQLRGKIDDVYSNYDFSSRNCISNV